MDDTQREAHYNAWREKQDRIESNCNHRWGYAEPIRCLECGKVKKQFKY